jgi:hypothetical protein
MRMKRRRFLTGMAVSAFAAPAFAADYLTPDEAKHLFFPDADQFVVASLERSVTALKIPASRIAHLRAFEARQGEKLLGFVVFDEVIGKFELIGYAVSLTPEAVVKAVEILSYRESHGYEIRQKAWRAQFVGKDSQAPIRLDNDISNISGATMSCTHVTDGIRQVVALVHATVTPA